MATAAASGDERRFAFVVMRYMLRRDDDEMKAELFAAEKLCTIGRWKLCLFEFALVRVSSSWIGERIFAKQVMFQFLARWVGIFIGPFYLRAI